MIEVLYCLEYRFMHKTFAAIQRHVDADAGYLALRPDASGAWGDLPEVTPANWGSEAIDDAVREVDPSVVVANSLLGDEVPDFAADYPLVHVRHGCSVGRGERASTTALDGVVDVALAPGERWARQYRTQFDGGVRTPVIGVPEADALVGTVPPGERRALYAPTNHNYGGGSYLRTAETVLDAFAATAGNDAGAGESAGNSGSTWSLRFRPHPHDRTEEPGRSVTERCRERIADLPNVTFDDAPTPTASVLDADLLISDYSGIVTEWLHTDRPLIQLTDVAADATVPTLGYTTDRLTLDVLERLWADGYPSDVERAVEERRSALGIPMDGRAGERAAREVLACTR